MGGRVSRVDKVDKVGWGWAMEEGGMDDGMMDDGYARDWDGTRKK